MATKRTSDSLSDEETKPLCKWGSLCYRKNPDHLKEFSHPHRKQKAESTNPAFPCPSTSKKPKLSPSNVSSPHTPQHPDAAYLQSCYEMPFPEDLFDLWAFCQDLNSQDPREALVPLLNFRLAGPFDALAMKGSLDTSDKKSFNLHDRYFYDPPEFQTVMVDVSNDCHLGYFRDDPNELPVFVAQSQLNRKDTHPWKLTIAGSNLMQVVHCMLKDRCKETKDPKLIETYTDILASVARVNQNKHFVSYKSKRKARAVGNVLHHVGMVVPYDEKTEVGYRPLPVKNVELRRLMQNVAAATKSSVKEALEPIQELVTLVNFANDECDYGMGLELGLDLFLYGNERLHSTTLFLLQNSYTLLNRPKFLEIVKHHIENRSNENLDYLKPKVTDSIDDES